jgi:predicted RNA binding protein YcfA (HicA-like mRNA interferase family)
MNSKQRKTLEAIFSAPTPKNLAWDDLVSLLQALGCDVETDGGSHFAFRRDNKKADFHRPHPGKELKPYQVRDVRLFLVTIGVAP